MAKKIPEHLLFDVEIEQILIGCVFRDNVALDVARSEIKPDTFYDPFHQRIFTTMVERRDHGLITPISLHAVMADDPAAPEITIGLRAYFSECAAAASEGAPVRQYCAILREMSFRRLAIQDMEDAIWAIRHTAQPVARVLRGVVAVSDEAGSSDRRGSVVMAEDVAKAVLAQAERAHAGERMPAVTTGSQKFDAAIGGMQGGDLIIIPGRSGMGKEQPVDTPTLTPFGWVELGSLRPGDFVIGSNGRPCRVMAVWPQGIKQAYELQFRDRTKVECGADHLWTVFAISGRKRGVPQTMSLTTLLAKGICDKPSLHMKNKAKWKLPIVEPVEFAPVEFPVDPYVLGVLLGDGAISGKDFRFSNPDIDRDIREEVRRRIPTVTIKEYRKGSYCPYYSLCGEEAKRIKKRLSDLRLTVKSGKKFIPHTLLFSSVEQRRDLLRGLMDTDGSCLNNRTHFYTTSWQLAHDVASLVRSLSGIAIIRTYEKSHLGKPTEYHVNVKMDVCPFYTARKKKHWRPTKPVKAIFTVAPTRMVEQVCITVDAEDGLYVTEGFALTHNSALLGGIALRAALAEYPTLFFSLEMTAQQLVRRFITDIDYDDQPVPMSYAKFRHGNLTAEELDRAARAAMQLNNLPLEICDAADLTVEDIGARARTFRAKHKDKLCFFAVDYLQRVQASANKDRSREQEVSHVAKALKTLAKALGCPVAAAAQLLSKGGDPKMASQEQIPTLAAIRESGQIEMEADIIVAPHRKAWFLRKAKPLAPKDSPEMILWEGEFRGCKNAMHGYGLKNREGGEFDLDLWCDMRSSAIRDEEPRIAMTAQDRAARDLLEGL